MQSIEGPDEDRSVQRLEERMYLLEEFLGRPGEIPEAILQVVFELAY